MIWHTAGYNDLRQDFAAVCEVVAVSSLIANFLPRASFFDKHPSVKYWYGWLIDLVAAFALNIRVAIPSLDQEFLGFRRRVRHSIRNWQQDRVDRRRRKV